MSVGLSVSVTESNGSGDGSFGDQGSGDGSLGNQGSGDGGFGNDGSIVLNGNVGGAFSDGVGSNNGSSSHNRSGSNSVSVTSVGCRDGGLAVESSSGGRGDGGSGNDGKNDKLKSNDATKEKLVIHELRSPHRYLLEMRTRRKRRSTHGVHVVWMS